MSKLDLPFTPLVGPSARNRRLDVDIDVGAVGTCLRRPAKIQGCRSAG